MSLALVATRSLVDARSPAAAELPRVRLVATGGTISNRTGGRLTADELLKSMPDARPLRARRRPSSSPTRRAASSRSTSGCSSRGGSTSCIGQDADLAGVVVTSGTDTLEELAYFLDLTVSDARPVVVVGSMRNPSTLGYEGAANLLEGFRVAAEPASRNKGVLVVMNDEINSAREVTKTDALRLQTFQSRSYGVLGVVDSDRVVYYRDVVKRHTAKSEFDLAGVTSLPRVDIVHGLPGRDGRSHQGGRGRGREGDRDRDGGRRRDRAGPVGGLPVRGVEGRVPRRWRRGRAAAGSRRAGRRCRRRRLRLAVRRARLPQATPPAGAAAAAAQPRPRRSFLAAEDLTPLKARILLMLALTKTQDADEMQRMFTEY